MNLDGICPSVNTALLSHDCSNCSDCSDSDTADRTEGPEQTEVFIIHQPPL